MNVQLLASTPEELAIAASKLCVGADMTNLSSTQGFETAVASGHHSILEHINFTFYIDGISRSCSHQLVRHRLCSFSQQSQRYVNMESAPHIVPDAILKNPVYRARYEKAIRTACEAYEFFLSSNIKKEDARQVLPNAMHTKLMMTCNAREFIHICELRLCSKAQQEIRELFYKMRELIKESHPTIYTLAQPPCGIRLNKCKEKKSCGKKWIHSLLD